MNKAYRYLLNLSYMGTPFRGAQRQLKIGDDKTTVQGNIEIALRKLKPVNDILVTTSSRTDSGVHALQTTMHTDLQRQNGEPYATESITYLVNKYFTKRDIPIRIISTYQVPDTFHCRYATSRTYLYRLVIINSTSRCLTHHIPIEDLNRAYYKCSATFDYEKFNEAAEMFQGLHDFRTFMGKAPRLPDKITRRHITRFETMETTNKHYSPFSWPVDWIKQEQDYKHYDIIVESSGFLYRQVSDGVS